MNPKEKAEELISKYLQYVDCGDNIHTTTIQKNNAKQCAIICVDEIMNCGSQDVFCDLDYWQEVKQEIESL